MLVLLGARESTTAEAACPLPRPRPHYKHSLPQSPSSLTILSSQAVPAAEPPVYQEDLEVNSFKTIYTIQLLDLLLI